MARLGYSREEATELAYGICNVINDRKIAQGLPVTILTPERLAGIVDGILRTWNGPEISPEENHDLWMQRMIADGWKYGETTDEAAKIHAALLPYGEIPDFYKENDRIFLDMCATYKPSMKVLVADDDPYGELVPGTVDKAVDSFLDETSESSLSPDTNSGEEISSDDFEESSNQTADSVEPLETDATEPIKASVTEFVDVPGFEPPAHFVPNSQPIVDEVGSNDDLGIDEGPADTRTKVVNVPSNKSGAQPISQPSRITIDWAAAKPIVRE